MSYVEYWPSTSNENNKGALQWSQPVPEGLIARALCRRLAEALVAMLSIRLT